MDRKQHATLLRQVRRVHRALGITLFVLFLLIGATGLLLGWKKNSGGYLLPDTQRGARSELAGWMPIDELARRAQTTLTDSLGPDLSVTLDRIDARPDKGILKFTFTDHYWEVQLDGATGEPLQVAKRWSDLLEQLHDGSVVDNALGLPGGVFKLFYTSTMSLALLTFSLTGFWLWYGPRRMRRRRPPPYYDGKTLF